MENSRRKRVLVIGLDGATWNVLDPMMKSGTMPNLLKIVNTGVRGTLRSTMPPVTAPAWTSFMTGKYPDKTGIYDFFNHKNGTYFWPPANSTLIKQRKIWEVLGNYGYKVGIFNLPVTYPPTNINGLMVTGVLTPGEYSKFTYPKDLQRKIRETISGYRIRLKWRDYENVGVRKFIKDLTRVTERRYEALRYCMKQMDWDFFIGVFMGMDWAQHCLWHYLDHDHSRYNPEESKKYLPLIKDYYNFLDEKIGNILAEIDDSANVIIISDHGFGPREKAVHLNNWLLHEGYLSYKAGCRKRILNRLISFVSPLDINYRSVYRFLEKLGIIGGISKEAENLNRFAGPIDWNKTKAFCRTTNGIHINLKGRERNGTVEQGKQYEELRDQIIDKFMRLRDPVTDKRIIYRVEKRESVFTGEMMYKAPDIIITDHDERFLTSYDPKSDIKSIFEIQKWKTGNHKRQGIFIAKGKDVKKGVKVEDSEIVDIFPTILYMMDIPIPKDVDGKVIKEIFNAKHLEESEIRFGSKAEDKQRLELELSKNEVSEIVRGLKGLGYID